MKRLQQDNQKSIRIMEIRLAANELHVLPRPLRTAALFYGYVANDLCVFQNLHSIAANATSSVKERSSIYRSYGNAQSLSLTRVLAGKTLEAWDAIKKGVDEFKPLQELRQSPEPSDLEAICRCEAYFVSGNRIKRVRNGFGFHMDPKHWNTKEAQIITKQVGIQIMLADQVSSLHVSSESLMMVNLMAALGYNSSVGHHTDPIPGELDKFIAELEAIVQEIGKYSQLLTQLCNSVVSMAVRQAIDNGARFESIAHEITDAQPIMSAKLPVVYTSSSDGDGASD